MHRCLQIQEILRIIADNVDRKRDLTSMACVCRGFYEPAMDAAWYDMPGMGPLMMCLPSQCWRIDEHKWRGFMGLGKKDGEDVQGERNEGGEGEGEDEEDEENEDYDPEDEEDDSEGDKDEEDHEKDVLTEGEDDLGDEARSLEETEHDAQDGEEGHEQADEEGSEQEGTDLSSHSVCSFDSEGESWVTMSRMRRPKPHHWDRFHHYARRVRELEIPSDFTLHGQRATYVDSTCWEQLVAAFPDQHILPNLRRLKWKDEIHLRVEYFRLFTYPGLYDIHFENDSDSDYAMVPMLDAFRRSALPCVPRIVKLSHFHDSRTGCYSPLLVELISSTLCAMDHLVDVYVNSPLTVDALAHLGTLKSLTSLRFVVARSDLVTPPRTLVGSAIFASLSVLKIETAAHDLGPLCSALRIFPSNRLLTLQLDLDYSFYAEHYGHTSQPTAQSLRRLFDSLCRFKALERISIVFDAGVSLAPEFVVDGEVLAPLLGLPGIRHCDFGHLPLDLSSSFIKTLAESWKSLESLDLGASWARGDIMQDTLVTRWGVPVEHLLPFSVHCPNLTSLRVRLASSDQSHPVVSGNATLSASMLCSLHLCGSDIEDEDIEPIASFVAFAFPQATVFNSWDKWGQSGRVSDRLTKLNQLKIEMTARAAASGGARV